VNSKAPQDRHGEVAPHNVWLSALELPQSVAPVSGLHDVRAEPPQLASKNVVEIGGVVDYEDGVAARRRSRDDSRL
jgi:hypothetical protein